MSQAERDENFVPTLLGVSNTDGATPVAVYADPTTHRLLVDASQGVVLQLTENTPILYDVALSADGKYSGMVMEGTAGATLAFGDLIYFNSSSKWVLADASDAITSGSVWLGICVLASTDTNPTTALLLGNIRADTAFPTFTIGAPIYASETAGDLTETAPTTTDSVTRVVGFAQTADSIFFNPSNDYITHV